MPDPATPARPDDARVLSVEQIAQLQRARKIFDGQLSVVNIDRLIASHEALRAALPAWRADAERLDWLERERAEIETAGRDVWIVFHPDVPPSEGAFCHSLREAIDAARRAPSSEGAET